MPPPRVGPRRQKEHAKLGLARLGEPAPDAAAIGRVAVDPFSEPRDREPIGSKQWHASLAGIPRWAGVEREAELTIEGRVEVCRCAPGLVAAREQRAIGGRDVVHGCRNGKKRTSDAI